MVPLFCCSISTIDTHHKPNWSVDGVEEKNEVSEKMEIEEEEIKEKIEEEEIKEE